MKGTERAEFKDDRTGLQKRGQTIVPVFVGRSTTAQTSNKILYIYYYTFLSRPKLKTKLKQRAKRKVVKHFLHADAICLSLAESQERDAT